MILADRNVGGIVGAMAMENDLDAYSDFEITGETSLNFESEVRCVVLNCTNQGSVTVKKGCGGGIVGNLTHLRLQIPQGCDSDDLTLYARDPNGQWIEVVNTIDGSYLVFATGGGTVQIALVQSAAIVWYWYALGIAAIALPAILVLKKRTGKKP